MFRLVSKPGFRLVVTHSSGRAPQLLNLPRTICTTQRNRAKDDSHLDTNLTRSDTASVTGQSSTPSNLQVLTPERFCTRVKDISSIKLRIQHLNDSRKVINSELRNLREELDKGLEDLGKMVDADIRANTVERGTRPDQVLLIDSSAVQGDGAGNRNRSHAAGSADGSNPVIGKGLAKSAKSITDLKKLRKDTGAARSGLLHVPLQ